MQKTTNYSLNKPEGNDYVNVEILNENADIIDATMSNLEYAVNNIDFSGIEQDIASVETKVDDVKEVVDTTKVNVDVLGTQVTSALQRTNNINTNVESLFDSIGFPSTSASNVTTENAHAKLNWLLTNVGTLINGRVVKSVQRGNVTLNSTVSYSQNVNISTVVPNKSLIIVDNASSVSNAGGIAGTIGVLNNVGTSINISTSGATATSATVHWQVIEFY